MKKNIVIIILCILLLGVSGYLVYDKVLSNKKEDNQNKDIINNPVDENIKEFTRDDFDKIVTSWLGLSSLLNKKSLNEMTNQEKLRMLIDLYNEEDKYSTFSQSKLEKIHSESVIKDLNITYESLSDYYGTFLWNDKLVGFEYNKNDKTFTYTGALGHGGSSRGNIAYSEMVSMDTDGKTYTVKYKYVFLNSTGDGPSDVKIYLNVNDALNDKNLWKYLEVGEDDSVHSKEYIQEHYDEIKDKLSIYTYKFKVENDKLVITDFSVDTK